MNNKREEEVIALVEKIEDKNFLEFLYIFIKECIEEMGV